MSKRYKGIVARARFNFAQCVFNHQVFEFAARREKRKENLLKTANLLLTILSLAALIDRGQTYWLNILGQYTVVAEIVLQLAQWSFDIGNLSAEHERTAKEYLMLREEYGCLLAEVEESKMNNDELSRRYRDLANRYSTICKMSHQTTNKDYEKAGEWLSHGNRKTDSSEAYTWSDDEIDAFLP